MFQQFPMGSMSWHGVPYQMMVMPLKARIHFKSVLRLLLLPRAISSPMFCRAKTVRKVCRGSWVSPSSWDFSGCVSHSVVWRCSPVDRFHHDDVISFVGVGWIFAAVGALVLFIAQGPYATAGTWF